MNWKKAQIWERKWWDKCLNTFFEEEKQLVYADRMGLTRSPSAKTPYQFDMEDKSVLDIGGGPVSLLLKCVNVRGYVVDPLMDKFPKWVKKRYRRAKILTADRRGEVLSKHPKVDEVWIYNCLQHTENPKKIIEVAKEVGDLIRMFEWVDTEISPGHPSVLREKKLNKWLGGEGKVEHMTKKCKGKAYYGIFQV